MRIIRSLAAAALALGLLAAPASAVSRRVHPTIDATGACAPELLPTMYVWKLHVAADPGDALVDVTMYDDSWQPDRTSYGLFWSKPYFPDIGSWINVTENLGPTLWVRWTDEPYRVFRFDAQSLCAIDVPPVDTGPQPTCCWEPAEGEATPKVTPPPTSTEPQTPSSSAPIGLFVLIALGSLGVLLATTVLWPRDEQW